MTVDFHRPPEDAPPPDGHEPRVRVSAPKLRETPVSAALIAICTLVAVLTRVGTDVEAVGRLTFSRPEDLREGADALAALRAGEVYRVLTPIFVHFGPFHVLFNLMWVKDLGGLFERLFGSSRLLLLVALVGALSNVAQFVFGGPSLFGGMSGVVYGLFGFLFARQRVAPVPYHIPRSTTGLLLGWMVLCFTGLLGPVANTAHLSGLVTGALVAIVARRR